VTRVESVVQLGSVIAQRREHGLGQPGLGVVVAGRPVVGVEIAEGIEPPEFVAHDRAADISVKRLVARHRARVGNPSCLEFGRQVRALEVERLAVVEEQTVNVVAAALDDEVVERAAHWRVGALAGTGDLHFLVHVRVLVLERRHDGALDHIPLRGAAEHAELRALAGAAAADIRRGELHARRDRQDREHVMARRQHRGQLFVEVAGDHRVGDVDDG
jgi:hypothetical protein